MVMAAHCKAGICRNQKYSLNLISISGINITYINRDKDKIICESF